MAGKNKKTSTISDIRTHLTGAIKDWHELTCDLIWPEHDNSMAAMDGHISTLRTVNAQLAYIEKQMPLHKQKSLVIHFDEESVQDPGKFASFAAEVELAIAA